MRNYMILNNQNSNTINGLIIQELAPISKPLQRTQVETIDGRDGDIVTPLGYAAYDKKITIGLYGDFDINEVIAYFATQGTAIFSNEPNKYYNYQILDQIDYERLVRFRVATVTMHVQPFKYSATEGTLTIDASDTVSGEGSDIALNGTAEAPFTTLRHKGNATQETTTGKNLLNYGQLAYSFPVNTNTRTVVGSINLTAGTTYYITYDVQTATSTSQRNTPYLEINGTQYYESTTSNYNKTTGRKTWQYVAQTTGTYTFGYWCHTPNVAVNIANFMVSTSSDNTFEPYTAGASPNPDYPQDINVVTGDSTVKITGKNLACVELDTTSHGITYTSDGLGALIMSGTSDAVSSFRPTSLNNFIHLKAGQAYTLSANNAAINGNVTIRLAYSNGVIFYSGFTLTEVNRKAAFAATQDALVSVEMRIANGTTLNDFVVRPQLELGNQATAYEQFKGQSYVIPFGDTYLAKVGNYADEPVKVGDTWYIRRAVGKAVLTGGAGIGQYNSTNNWFYVPYSSISADAGVNNGAIMSDYFTGTTSTAMSQDTSANGLCSMSTNNIFIRNTSYTTTADYRTWLASHNTTIYYALATPTDEAITDQNLIDALDGLYNQAHAYKGQTNIAASAESGNAPAILAVDVNENNESTVTNAGNTTSRPILTIYGQGNIGVYINGVEVLQVALGDEQYITLDSAEMEAYKDTTANLKNRLVTGDYSKLALNAGANKIYFSGIVTKYEISKYSRWL